MQYNSCNRMTVTAIGIDRDSNVHSATNGNIEECSGIEGDCGCTHAEVILLKEMENPPFYVIISHSPCIECAMLLVDAGVETVAYLKEYRLVEGIKYLIVNNVKVLNLQEESITYQPKNPINYVKIEGSFEL